MKQKSVKVYKIRFIKKSPREGIQNQGFEPLQFSCVVNWIVAPLQSTPRDRSTEYFDQIVNRIWTK